VPKPPAFFVQLFFVGIDDPQTNIDRVQLRVAQGGHDVLADKIVPRWNRTMALLHRAVEIADQSFCSTTAPLEVSARVPCWFLA
jgi:predicted ABC-type ATPase